MGHFCQFNEASPDFYQERYDQTQATRNYVFLVSMETTYLIYSTYFFLPEHNIPYNRDGNARFTLSI